MKAKNSIIIQTSLFIFIFQATLPSAFAADVMGAAMKAGGGALALTMVNKKTGQDLWDACRDTSGSNPALCGMAALSFVSAGLDLKAAKKARDVKNAVDSTIAEGEFPSLTEDPTTPPPPGPDGRLEDIEKEIVKATNELCKDGFCVNTENDTVTTPQGKFPISAFKSPKSMADAGLISANQIPEMEALFKKLNKDSAKIMSVGVAGGGGGGSSGQSVSYLDENPYRSLYGKPNAPKTAGLTRTLASGETIGAQTDNLFEMVRRRYQQKSDENIFVGQQQE